MKNCLAHCFPSRKKPRQATAPVYPNGFYDIHLTPMNSPNRIKTVLVTPATDSYHYSPTPQPSFHASQVVVNSDIELQRPKPVYGSCVSHHIFSQKRDEK